MLLQVTKMHGLGNNYIYVSEFEEHLAEDDIAPLARLVSDVRKGIGSDGLILVGPSNSADVRMRIFNADGSEAETCGNGLRCVAKYAYERGYVTGPEFAIETKAGISQAIAHVEDDGLVHRVTVDMGRPEFGAQAVGFQGAESEPGRAKVDAADGTYEGWMVSMGNPHFVTWVDDAPKFPVAKVGPAIERNPLFSSRTNVEFVTARGRNELDFRVWERGSGITYACGTGACAGVAAGVQAGLLDSRVTVHLLGGDLDIVYEDNRVWMTGDAVEVFRGELRVPAL